VIGEACDIQERTACAGAELINACPAVATTGQLQLYPVALGADDPVGRPVAIAVVAKTTDDRSVSGQTSAQPRELLRRCLQQADSIRIDVKALQQDAVGLESRRQRAAKQANGPDIWALVGIAGDLKEGVDAHSALSARQAPPYGQRKFLIFG